MLLLKSKWFWIFITVSSLIGFMYHYGGLKEKLAEAYSTVTQITQTLETANRSISRLEDQMSRLDVLIKQRDEQRRQIDQEYEKRISDLLQERDKNVSLSECWDVEFSDDYLNRLRNDADNNNGQ